MYIIGFLGTKPWIRIASGSKPPIKIEHILVAVNRINTFGTGKSTISNVLLIALIWINRPAVLRCD
jgi:hypothetical protein